MQFNPLSVAKFVVSGIVGLGTGKIVSGIIKNNVSPETLIDKVTIVAASWVIAGVATNSTKKYSDDLIDDVTEFATSIASKIKLGAKLGRIDREESTFEKEGLDEANFEKTPDGKWVPIAVVEDEESDKPTNVTNIYNQQSDEKPDKS